MVALGARAACVARAGYFADRVAAEDVVGCYEVVCMPLASLEAIAARGSCRATYHILWLLGGE